MTVPFDPYAELPALPALTVTSESIVDGAELPVAHGSGIMGARHMLLGGTTGALGIVRKPLDGGHDRLDAARRGGDTAGLLPCLAGRLRDMAG